jgi:hypothetical protein
MARQAATTSTKLNRNVIRVQFRVCALKDARRTESHGDETSSKKKGGRECDRFGHSFQSEIRLFVLLK